MGNTASKTVVAVLLGFVAGYFAGREHIKFEMRTAIQSAAEGLSETLASAFGKERIQVEPQDDGHQEVAAAAFEKADYIDKYIDLYDLSAGHYIERWNDAAVPGVLFKIRNRGDRSLDRVKVTVYFKDHQGAVIAEEEYNPVFVNEYSFSSDNKPLKPDYIWQMEQGKFYHATSVPSEWEVGNVAAAITNIRFSE